VNAVKRFLSRWSTLQVALAISIAFHASILTLRVAAPERFDRLFQDTPLEVILVNTRIKADAPDKAQALAQTQLAGGGDLRSGRAASPLPNAPATESGNSAQVMKRQVEALRKEQSLLLAQVKKLISQLPPPQPQKSQAEQEEVEQKRRQLLKLLAEIELRIEQDNARPRKHYVSPATREVAYAQYYDALRLKIEERGTRYFPVRDGQKNVRRAHHDHQRQHRWTRAQHRGGSKLRPSRFRPPRPGHRQRSRTLWQLHPRHA